MSGEDDQPEEKIDKARRLLLKSTVYAAPIVLSLVEVNTAHAQPSCPPPPACGPPPGCPPNP